MVNIFLSKRIAYLQWLQSKVTVRVCLVKALPVVASKVKGLVSQKAAPFTRVRLIRINESVFLINSELDKLRQRVEKVRVIWQLPKC